MADSGRRLVGGVLELFDGGYSGVYSDGDTSVLMP